MPFRNIIDFNAIYPRLAATSKTQIIESLSWTIGRDPQFFNHADPLLDSAALAEQFIIAEEIQSSAMGEGVVVLHLSSPYLRRPFIALARLTSKIDWQADDGVFVDLVGIVLSPSKIDSQSVEKNRDKGIHLQSLSRVTRLLTDPKIAVMLRASDTIEDIRNILEPTRLDILAA